jgi:serine/threonine protein kinase
MGEVYRATDTNLGREVAIKVLPAAVAQDAERLARLREAKLLASLNHPNIAHVYGFESATLARGRGAPHPGLERGRRRSYDVDPFSHDATDYDVTRDGQRFLMVRLVADPARSRQQLNVVVNWYGELLRLQGGAR